LDEDRDVSGRRAKRRIRGAVSAVERGGVESHAEET